MIPESASPGAGQSPWVGAGTKVHIAGHALRSRVLLAPMAGVSDLPFRELCWRHGAGLVVSEMIAADARLMNTLCSQRRRAHAREISPRSIQIVGCDPDAMAQAARFQQQQGAEIIDINMGCPAKRVCRKLAGSALLKDEALVGEILRRTVQAVTVPVTLKMRTGWSPQQRNAVTIARIAEDAGIAALAVHGRTRADRFNGQAEFRTIADMVRAVDIPVFANGDIDSPGRAAEVLHLTGAAGVMIGRAACGRPWLHEQIDAWIERREHKAAPSPEQQCVILLEHLRRLHQFYGEVRGVRIARRHAGWFLDSWQDDAFRAHFNRLESAAAQLHAVAMFFRDRQACMAG